MRKLWVAFLASLILVAPAAAETPRQLLESAAFATNNKAAALARIEAALARTNAILARTPKDWETRLQQAIAIGYRGKLKRSRSDAQKARQAFEALVAARPRDAEAQLAVAAWHLGAIIELGPLVARTALGARRNVGLEALNRAVASSGDRALIPAYAALTRIQLDPKDVASARALAENAVAADARTLADRAMQRNAAALLPHLRKGDGRAAAKLAEELMPFARLAR